MKEAAAMKIIIAGAALLLSLSAFIAVSEEKGITEETAIIIEERTTTLTENTEAEETITKSPTEEEELWININTADERELEKLDGIGAYIASEIVKYRQTNGNFRNREELMNVSGIGEGVYLKIKDNIYVENPVYETTTEPTTTAEPTEAATVTEPYTIIVEYPLDLNTATKEELMTLPYVEEQEAEAILDLRNRIGSFSHEYELLYVEELEQKEVAEIIEFVTVSK